MDPFTALSVAGNIVQFVDFAVRIVAKGNHIYHSSDGLPDDHHDLEIVTEDLLLLTKKLRKPLQEVTGLTDKQEQDTILILSQQASDLAEKLMGFLNKAKIQGKNRKWKSLRQAIKGVTSKAEVDSMTERLSSYKSELQLRLVANLRYSQNLLGSRVSTDAK